MKPVTLPREHSDAIRRVLGLVDKYMGHHDQATLYGIDGGLWTTKELRGHVKAVKKLLPRERAE
jgi:hypothetical protein